MNNFLELYEAIEAMELRDVLTWKAEPGESRANLHKYSLYHFHRVYPKKFRTFFHEEVLYIVRVE